MHHLKLLVISHRQNYSDLLCTSNSAQLDELRLGLAVPVSQLLRDLLAFDAGRDLFAFGVITKIAILDLC